MRIKLTTRTALAGLLGVLIAAGVAIPADAALMLTPAGVADGFHLSVFASNFAAEPICGLSCAAGPGGIATTGDGHILVADILGGIAEFQDRDGQNAAHPLSSSAVGVSFGGMTNAGGHVFFMDNADGLLVRLNDSGTIDFTHPFLRVGGLGLATDPVNQHILMNSSQGILDIDPNPANWFDYRLVAPVAGDGIAVSNDGKTVYSANGNVVGYDMVSGQQVFDSGSIPGGADGVGVISGGAMAGDLVVNGTFGVVTLIDPRTNQQTEIATGGSRGDFTGVDLNNGSLLLTQSAEVDRLTCTSCSFSGSPSGSSVPEPANLWMLLTGLAGMGPAVRYRRSP